ncbi:MAG: HPF/RaiA family ribosome-associated protein [candidate division Zixibacteria bacterium]|nr:HPF/RaiA family ribosome-associated protein [candidate division Zixibacteria bacterium]
MQLKVTARHFDLTDSLNSYAVDELKRLQKYSGCIIDAELTMDIEKHEQIAELTVKAYRGTLTSVAGSRPMELAIKDAVSKTEINIQMHMAKLREKKSTRKWFLKTRPLTKSLEIIIDADVDQNLLAGFLFELANFYSDISGGDELIIRGEGFLPKWVIWCERYNSSRVIR